MGRYNQRLFRVARAITKNDIDAEDVVQQVYVSAYLSKVPFAGNSCLATWLMRIAINEAVAIRARQTKRIATTSELHQFEFESTAFTPEEQASHQEVGRLLERAIDALPDTYRVVFIMRELEGLNGYEVAALLGLSDEAVRVRLYRAKSLLRDKLEAFSRHSIEDLLLCAGERCLRITSAAYARLCAISDDEAATAAKHRAALNRAPL